MTSTQIRWAIRPVEGEHRSYISALARQSKEYWGYSKEFMRACAGELTYTVDDITEHTFWLAQCDGQIGGFYALVQLGDGDVELDALFVAPEFIGQGLGRLLMTHAVDTARQSGAVRLIIQGDPNAAGFYAAVGALKVGERESDSIPGRFLPLFHLSLVDT